MRACAGRSRSFLTGSWFVVLVLACRTTGPAEDLVEVTSAVPGVVVDLKYATQDNFTGRVLYDTSCCFLRRGTAEKLRRVQLRLEKRGYRLKIWDGYRPLFVQKRMWELVPDPRFVADPRVGSRHNRGAAVDVTLVDSSGRELEMPTGFDDFSERARRDYDGCSPEAKRNRQILEDAMRAEGFVPLPSEWWHFDDADWRKYKVVDIPIRELVQRSKRQE
ncbi:MAG: D-alanyl-D-alanine dipeptidase [candidate division KSB1 bacterium]|nr:D-alanyl-D-alanine dipeptidase [candidate division KSB1 bacterium]